jgi:hypothetical protein
VRAVADAGAVAASIVAEIQRACERDVLLRQLIERVVLESRLDPADRLARRLLAASYVKRSCVLTES